MRELVSNGLKVLLVEEANRIARLGLTPMTQGNLSLLDQNSKLVLITPHDYPYELMRPDDIVVVDLEGNVKEGRLEPSHETPVHCVVYQQRPGVGGIVHSEPIWTNCFGALGKPIQPVFVNMAIDVGGEVPVMPFAPSGNKAFAYEMLRVMGERNAVIWANHGLLTVGKTIQKAVRCTVMVEAAAQVYHLALELGEPSVIPTDVIQGLIG